MKKHAYALVAAALIPLSIGLSGCAGSGSGWETLVDNGVGLDNFDRFREANWQVKDSSRRQFTARAPSTTIPASMDSAWRTIST